MKYIVLPMYLVLCLAIGGVSNAWGSDYTTAFTINRFGVHNGFVVVDPSVSTGITKCENNDRLILPITHQMFDQLFSVIMLTHTSQSPIVVLTGDCVSAWGTTFPGVFNIVVRQR